MSRKRQNGRKTWGRIVQLTMAVLLIGLVGFLFAHFSDGVNLRGPGTGDTGVVGDTGFGTGTTAGSGALDATSTPAPTAAPKPKQGSIQVIHTDESTGWPIEGAAFDIVDRVSGAVAETIRTDSEGVAVSGLLDYGTAYTIRQSAAADAFKPAEDAIAVVEIGAAVHQVESSGALKQYVKAIALDEDGSIAIQSVYMDVPVVMQKPELPNGCEITSLTAVLNYYGYEADKIDMADNYLPREPWARKDGKLFGADPYKAYAGDPKDQPGGFFSYAPPIVAAAEKYISEHGGSESVRDISGSTRDEIVKLLEGGTPVVLWTTLDMTPPKVTYSWYFHDTGELFNAPVNLHVTVLNGYDAENNIAHVMNPLEGQRTYNADVLFKSYAEMGSHALVVER